MSPEHRCDHGAKEVAERRSCRPRRRLLPVLAAAVSCLAFAPSAMAAGLGFGGPQVSLSGLQCATPGNCTAVGDYYDGLGHGQAAAWTERSGRWATGVRLLPPSNAAPNAFDTFGIGGGITSLSCPTARNCAAVGDYLDTAGNVRGVLFKERNGHWSHGVRAQMPGDRYDPSHRGPNGSGYATLPAVSCVSNGNCVAVGAYLNRHGAVRSVMFVESNGSWESVKRVSLPSDALTGNYEDAQLTTVSCTPDGTCTAVGSYADNHDNQQGWAVTIHGGSVVTSAKLPMPSGPDTADPSPSPRLTSISCVDATDCAAVGNYSIDYNSHNNGNLAGVLLVEHSGTWQATEAQLPSSAAPISTAYAQDTALLSVDCPTIASCSAVGYYSDTNTNIQGEVMNETSVGTWTSPAQQVALPGNAASDIQTQLVLPGPVSCSSAGYCGSSAVFANVTGNELPLLAYEAGGTWSSTTMGLPRNAGADQEVGGLAEISCPALNPPTITTNNDCTVLGEYQEVGGFVEGFATTQKSGGTWGRPTELRVPPPTRAELRTTVERVLLPTGHNAKLKRIRKRNGYSFHYRAVESGTLTITWRIRYHHHRRLIGRVRIYPPHRGRFPARVRLNRFGHDWMMKHDRVRVKSRVVFKHRRIRPVVARGKFTLHK